MPLHQRLNLSDTLHLPPPSDLKTTAAFSSGCVKRNVVPVKLMDSEGKM